MERGSFSSIFYLNRTRSCLCSRQTPNGSNFCSLLWPPRTLFHDKSMLSSTISISYFGSSHPWGSGQCRQLPASRTDSSGQEITTWEQEGAWTWVLHTRCLCDLHYPGNDQLILAGHAPEECGGQQPWEEQVSHENWGNRGSASSTANHGSSVSARGSVAQCKTFPIPYNTTHKIKNVSSWHSRCWKSQELHL